jgi:hypothetical protein
MVRSEGDTRVMEQLGEKQDLEAALSRLGFRHEDFVVTVRRAQPKAAGAWAFHYAVRIANRETAKSHIYWGGLGENWVAYFARDLAAGLFGRSPIQRQFAVKPRPDLNHR